MKKYLYSSHLGGLFWNDTKIDNEYLYCEECGDYDEFLGEASNKEEAKAADDNIKRGWFYKDKIHIIHGEEMDYGEHYKKVY